MLTNWLDNMVTKNGQLNATDRIIEGREDSEEELYKARMTSRRQEITEI